MRPQTKLRGGSESQLTQLKKLWRSWSDAQRESWREVFVSAATQADIREQVQAKLGLKLKYDSQLNAFRAWLANEDEREREAELTAEDEAELKARGLVGEALRMALLEKITMRAYTQGDHKLGLQAVDRNLKAQAQTLERDKFEFDATRAALAKLPELKAIAANKSLSEDERLEQARLALFGSAPQ
jgi:hypothetical protein